MPGYSSPEDLLMDGWPLKMIDLALNNPLGSWSTSCKVGSYQDSIENTQIY